MEPVAAKILFDGMWNDPPPGLMISQVVTDSRAVVPGCAFVAIKGERADGHDFAAGAYAQGAAVIVAQHAVEGVPEERTLLVQNVLDSIITMGANYRAQYQPLVLGITGSVGKTTTKEFCGAVFASFDKTLKTEGNQNNEIGLPNTLFRLDASIRYAVLEMGMSGLGEIHKLSVAARPDAAVITHIGPSHIEALGSLENILQAKLEICDGLAQGAPLVMNGDCALLWEASLPAGVVPVYAGIQNIECEVRGIDLSMQPEGHYFTIADKRFGEHRAFIPAVGRHNVYDALLAYTAATRLGLNAEQCVQALADFKTTGMRQNIVDKNGVVVIEDCYNANPDSMQAALNTLSELEIPGRRIAVLGDMLELGHASDAAHRQLGSLCVQLGIDVLVTVGQQAQLAAKSAEWDGVKVCVCSTNTEASDWLNASARKGDAVLVKASRGMKFEEILAKFQP